MTDARNAYFHIVRRNHKWTVVSVLHLSDKDAHFRLDRELHQTVREQHQTGKIRPCEWGVKKALKTAGE